MGCCCKKRKESDIFSPKGLAQDNLLEESVTESQINEVKVKVNLDYFENIKLLGKGTFGKVLLVKLKSNNTYYAMKILNKNQLKKSKQEIHTKNERDIMIKISSPFIVSIKFAFQDETNLYLVSEFMQGGELFFHLRKEKYFSEEFVKFYAMELVLAISHIHEKNAVYRDLKPENILLDKYGHIKLTDFGLAKILKDNEKAFTICGTYKYIAPEILLNRGYKKEVDWWSFGCVLFQMLEGKAPFGSPKGQMTLSFYKKKLNFYYTDSDITKQFIKELLVINPENRLGYGKDGATKIKNHKFFNGVDWDKALRKEYKPPFVPELLDELDLKYFDKTFTEEKLDLNKIQKSKTSESFKSDNNYKNFSYVDNNINEALIKNDSDSDN